MSIHISVIIPARNEAALICQTIDAVLVAVSALAQQQTTAEQRVEILVIDNASTDQTIELLQPYIADNCVSLVRCSRLGSASARNTGAHHARGDVLVFLDADTLLPPNALSRILHHCTLDGYFAGITRLAPTERGWRARLWWWFWSEVRRLPIPRAKAMPALMFCTRTAFNQYGPFDERVSIGEEWPILAGIYRRMPRRFIYDQGLIARSSSRRMTLQPFGYARTFGRYLWAVLHHSGRINYPDTVRHADSPSTTIKEQTHADPAMRHAFGDRLGGRPALATPRRDGDTARIAGDGG